MKFEMFIVSIIAMTPPCCVRRESLLMGIYRLENPKKICNSSVKRRIYEIWEFVVKAMSMHWQMSHSPILNINHLFLLKFSTLHYINIEISFDFLMWTLEFRTWYDKHRWINFSHAFPHWYIKQTYRVT